VTPSNYSYSQYFTNSIVSFIPAEISSSSIVYSFYFKIFSSITYISPAGFASTTNVGFFINTLESSVNTSNVTSNSSSGVGYSIANITTSYNNITIDTTGALYVNDMMNNNLIVNNTFKLNGIRINNYDSGWFAVSSNSTYNLTHNLDWAFPNPPFIRAFYSDNANPTLGTNNIYEISVNSMSGLYNDTTNYQYGIGHIRHISNNQLRISTAVRGIYYSTGDEGVSAQTSGYYRVIMYR